MNERDEADWKTRDRAYLDAYVPLSPGGVAPATGSASSDETEIEGEEQPIATGTLFLTIVLLMLIFGIWAILYGMLLGR